MKWREGNFRVFWKYYMFNWPIIFVSPDIDTLNLFTCTHCKRTPTVYTSISVPWPSLRKSCFSQSLYRLAPFSLPAVFMSIWDCPHFLGHSSPLSQGGGEYTDTGKETFKRLLQSGIKHMAPSSGLARIAWAWRMRPTCQRCTELIQFFARYFPVVECTNRQNRAVVNTSPGVHIQGFQQLVSWQGCNRNRVNLKWRRAHCFEESSRKLIQSQRRLEIRAWTWRVYLRANAAAWRAWPIWPDQVDWVLFPWHHCSNGLFNSATLHETCRWSGRRRTARSAIPYQARHRLSSSHYRGSIYGTGA